MLIYDTDMAGPGQPSLVYGLRGSLVCDIDMIGASRDLHAGRYGGAVPNPLEALCALVAGFYNENSSVAIAGFYDDVREPSPAERRYQRRHATRPTSARWPPSDCGMAGVSPAGPCTNAGPCVPP